MKLTKIFANCTFWVLSWNHKFVPKLWTKKKQLNLLKKRKDINTSPSPNQYTTFHQHKYCSASNIFTLRYQPLSGAPKIQPISPYKPILLNLANSSLHIFLGQPKQIQKDPKDQSLKFIFTKKVRFTNLPSVLPGGDLFGSPTILVARVWATWNDLATASNHLKMGKPNHSKKHLRLHLT